MTQDPISLYRSMLEIRECETQLNALFAQNKFPGYIHSYLGQEACAVGICADLNERDYVVSNHRGRGHYLAKGMALKPMVAEMLGKETGICGGRGGEMHAADPELGILGGNGIVGAGMPIAAGAALSAQMDGEGAVAAVFFGEGASNNGSFGETLNIAAAWKLPLVMVCENNLYAEMTPFADTVAQPDVAARAAGYGMESEVVDGNDVLAVRAAAGRAYARARAGEGPTLLELKTYRWGGHFEGDPRKYRSKEEEAEWKALCPVARYRAHLLDEVGVEGAQLEALETKIAAEVAEAVEFALNSPLPEPRSALSKVFAGSGAAPDC
ncbi:thiamine pyrophosphate-dependent dehydrogenase E1 component subunit alpha [Pseudohoeflea coraliihabitans]|uniref:Thiamine pyrophosphate-dependent dehydrogenase E1 component subunit alpha n=1 Tax=Pseudohoeflea coraliihabitans TaxID=2860393 RepID=A0ABS6WJ72_9HYPH|nr:thiamine pyrophosphate-dependent dehydrogenase E1 component subunit alpha [Pseudohoeflea sp. DP4N28-3]MBW3095981.1 thiamine pyrophosphate-dependent dehydrogenase E1 component subunit alpha [Pseudohoeflea sp. DP4N28-3]